MSYPNAIGPALRLYGRVLKAHWPILFALTAAYPLISWGASLAWKVPPVATSAVETGLKVAQTLIWATAWGLMGAMLAQLTLATTDRRPAGPTALLRAGASALPIIVVFVLLSDATSLPVSLWRSQLSSGQLLDQAGLMLAVTLPFAALDGMVFWLLVMAVPVRLDRGLSILDTLKTSARLGLRRWKTMLLVFLLTGLAMMAFVMFWQTQVFGRLAGADGNLPGWLGDGYLLKAPLQVLSMAWTLFWPVLYVVFRDQEGVGDVAETFD